MKIIVNKESCLCPFLISVIAFYILNCRSAKLWIVVFLKNVKQTFLLNIQNLFHKFN